MVVLLTDGRANVSLAKSNRDPDALAEDAPKPSTVRSMLSASTSVQTAVRPDRRHLMIRAADGLGPGILNVDRSVPLYWHYRLSVDGSMPTQLRILLLCCRSS